MSKTVYSGRVINVELITVRLPNGRECELELVRHPGGAAVVAVDDLMRVCLLRQYRYAANGWLWELPAGRIDPGEAAEHTARRELAEEAGLTASRWSSLGSLLSSPGVFTEVVHLYMAQGLEHVGADTEEHEVIEVHWTPLEEALEWAHDGIIQDAKTQIGLIRAQRLLRSEAGGDRAQTGRS